MTTTLAQAADAGNGGVLNEALLLTVVGMLVVFVALVLLLGMIKLLGRFGGEAEPGTGAQDAAPSKAQQEVTDPELIAIFAAAATTVLEQPVQVQSARAVEIE